MKKTMKIRDGLMIFGLWVFMISGTALCWAQSSGLELPQRVAARSQQGHLSELIYELAALLIIDENDHSALEQILNLGRRQDVSAVDRLQLFQLESLYQQRNNLLFRLEEQKMIQQELHNNFQNRGGIPKVVAPRSADVLYPQGFLPTGSLTRLPDEFLTGNPLESLNRQWGQQTLFYEAQLADLLRQNDVLRAEFRKQDLRFQDSAFVGMQPLLQDSTGEVVGQIRQELDLLYQQMGVLRHEVDLRNQTIDRLSGEVMTLTLDSLQKDQYLQEKFTNIETMREELVEMESRFRFGQTIIEAKDKKIEILEMNLSELKQSLLSFKATFQQEMQVREQRMAEFDGILKIYQAKLKDAVDRNQVKDRQIEEMADDLAVLRDALGDKVVFLGKTFQNLDKLQNEVLLIKTQLEQYYPQERTLGPTTKHLKNRVYDLEAQLESTRVFLEKFQFE